MHQEKNDDKEFIKTNGPQMQNHKITMSIKRGTKELTNFCRACLKKRDNMKFLVDNSEEIKSLVAKFSTVLNREVELISKYPLYICKVCEKTINISFEFREQCKSSNHLICQYLERQNETSKVEANNYVGDYDKSNLYHLNSEVLATIDALNSKYKQDFVCIFCSLRFTTNTDLQLHVYKKHHDSTENWCSVCNKLSANVKEHLEGHNKDFLCKFCHCQFYTAEALIGHLLNHKDTNKKSTSQGTNNQVGNDRYTCLHCNTFYPTKRCLKDHLITHSNKRGFIGENIKAEDNMLNINIQENISTEELKTKTPSQRMRLKQYGVEDIEKAVNKVREKLYKHVTCVFCQFEATSNRTLSVHVTRVHSGFKGQWCSACNKVFDDLAQHSKGVHYEDLKCPFCDKIQSNMGHFMEHMASHSGTRLHKCMHCPKSFISSRHLRSHQETHIDERSFGCKICKKKFLHSKILRTHIRLVHKRLIGPQNFCQKCNKKVRSLMEHNVRCHTVGRVITDDKQNLCPHCGKQFRTQSKLTVHIRTHTGETPYKCRYCDKKLKTRNILVVHERTHTGEKPYTCTVCGKSFAQSSVLNTHLRIHTGRPEQCKICDKRFCRPAELRLHLRKHTGEKPFSCDICHHSFKQRSHLVEHTKRHSNNRPYKCNFCEKAFKNIGTFKCHSQIHTGDKPFKCSQCSYACRQPYSLTQHMQQHENDRPQANYPHTCEICQRSFGTMAHLTTHYNRFHSHINIKPLDKLEQSNDPTDISTISFVPESMEFVDQAQPILINGSNPMQVNEPVQRGAVQNELNQPKYDPMYEFTVI